MGQQLIDNRQFLIGTIAEDYFRQITLDCLPALEYYLNQHIQLSSYSDQLSRIYFAPIIFRASNTIHQEERSYDPKKKELMLQIKVNGGILEAIDNREFVDKIGKVLVDNLREITIVPEALSQKVKQLVNEMLDEKQ